MTPWEIRTIEFANCNCAYGCPCQFNAYPTHGNCEAVVCNEITEGHYGDVKLDGLRFGGVFQGPRPFTRATARPNLSSTNVRAPPNARRSSKSCRAQDTDPFATVFAVFASTLTEAYDPIFAPIEFDVDVDARKGRFVVAGVAECVGEPIKNPVTGAEHRARIDIPHGFEYEIAEMGSGTATTQGKIQLKLKDSYGQFARLHLNNHGVVKNRAV